MRPDFTVYILEFDKEQDLDEAARMLAGVAEISKIQFSLERKKRMTARSIRSRMPPTARPAVW